ncbi:MAG: MFS transporter, partial [Chloroflexi bacterium]|nr:MFS transporter [Chloroflexota bacterium]
YLLTFGFMPLATVPAGRLADLIGGQPTVTITGVLVLASMGLVAVLPSYRRIGDARPRETAASRVRI